MDETLKILQPVIGGLIIQAAKLQSDLNAANAKILTLEKENKEPKSKETKETSNATRTSTKPA